MTSEVKTIIYPVRDIARAKALFSELLGVPPTMDEPYYVGYRVGDQDIGLDPNGHGRGMTGPIAYWHVDDLPKTLERLIDAGAVILHPPSDVGGGKVVASVTDSDGNPIGLIQSP